MAGNGNITAGVNETTALISREPSPKPRKWGTAVLYKALLCGFLVSLSFGVTQVPLLYSFRLMTCEAYYDTHEPPPPGTGDRCANHEIEARTSTSIAILVMSTTFFGVFNLFVTRSFMSRFGIRWALVSQIFCPAVRIVVQNIGVMTGGERGILILQCSQIITIVGGPAGHLLALNNYVAEVIEPSERTGALGQLQGAGMFGMSFGFLAGGIISDIFDIAAPFRVSWILFLCTCVYVLMFLPRVPNPEPVVGKASVGLARLFGPVKTFAPQRWRLKDGRVQTQYGTLLLGVGVFFGILSTGYIPVLLQMYSTDVLGFGTTENGALISMTTMVRGLFLTLAFPRIITHGRKWMNGHKSKTVSSKDSGIPDLPTEAEQFVGDIEAREAEEPIEPISPGDEREVFDLQFTKYSLLADGIITGLAMFVREGWQMYLVAVLLPFASGTGSSAKGTILQMCTAAERQDALSAITLIEMIARLTTTSLFGVVFAAFANIGQTHLVFTVNAAVAVLGFIVLLFCTFPPSGSTRYLGEEDEEDNEPSDNTAQTT